MAVAPPRHSAAPKSAAIGRSLVKPWTTVTQASAASSRRAPDEPELVCPYIGMRPYTAANATCFHGRDREIAEIFGRLRAGEREIYVVGPSGSGKSSLVAAGLLPRLTGGVPGLGQFLCRSLGTGEHPAARLAHLLEADLRAPTAALEVLLSAHAPGRSSATASSSRLT